MVRVLSSLPISSTVGLTSRTGRAPFTLGLLTDAPVACLLIHGFSGGPLENALARHLPGFEHGIRVEGVQLAGHSWSRKALTHDMWNDAGSNPAEGLEAAPAAGASGW